MTGLNSTTPTASHHTEGHGPTCIRCSGFKSPETGAVRSICSTCDLALQQMHHALEHVLFNRTVYMPEGPDEEQSPQWFKSKGYALTKPPTPFWRSYYNAEQTQVLLN